MAKSKKKIGKFIGPDRLNFPTPVAMARRVLTSPGGYCVEIEHPRTRKPLDIKVVRVQSPLGERVLEAVKAVYESSGERVESGRSFEIHMTPRCFEAYSQLFDVRLGGAERLHGLPTNYKNARLVPDAECDEGVVRSVVVLAQREV